MTIIGWAQILSTILCVYLLITFPYERATVVYSYFFALVLLEFGGHHVD